jgi:oligopeptide/dipeptide ABC transporter ATP-binding protein
MLDHPNPIAEIQGLRVEFQTKDGPVVGVEDVSFSIAPGETVCVVGESGSGKSVTSLSLMRLIEFGGGEIEGGRLLFDRGGRQIDLRSADASLMRTIRGNEIGMIFQEPMTSLNPVFTVERQLTEGLRVHMGMTRDQARARALELLRQVRIPEPERRLGQYPHELSGGMRQRVMIAMALACEPRLLIADEPTTALDVTIQAQILDLLSELRGRLGMAVILITHDLGVVAEVCDRVVVMYAGQVVEHGTVDQIVRDPRHPYTEGLLHAVPRLGSRKEMLAVIPGTVPSPVHWPIGCRFHDRCPYGWDKCVAELPPLLEAGGPDRLARCWLETAPERRAEVRARGAFGVSLETARAPAEEYHERAAAAGDAPPPAPGPPSEPPRETTDLPAAEQRDLATQRRRPGEPPAGGAHE